MKIAIHIPRAWRTAALTLLLLPGAAAAHTVRYEATLTGAQQNPAVATGASGVATLELNAAHDTLSMFVSIHGLDFVGATPDPDDDVLAMHIHRGAPGSNGPVVFGLIGPNHDVDGDLATLFDSAGLGGALSSAWDGSEGNNTTLADELANLAGGLLYFNVHTPGNPGGEIRGQIVAASPVPLPPAAWLLGGVLGGGLLRQRRAR
ncbi:MAG: CHRD domain-containing protein [Gammaproteobacteria bacterium]